MRLKDIGLKTKIVGGGLIPIALAAALLVLVGMSFGSVIRSISWVDHTHRTIRQTVEIQATAMGMMAWLRGFLLTGNERFANEYKSREAEVEKQLTILKKTVSDNDALAQKLAHAEELFNGWAKNTIPKGAQMRRDILAGKSMDDMVALVASEQGSKHFDQFRTLMQSYIQTRQTALTRFRDEAANAAPVEGSHYASKPSDKPYVTLQLAKDTLTAALDMETGLRGYLLSGKDEYLHPYKSGSELAQALLSQQKALVAKDPGEEKLIKDLELSLTTWIKEVAEPEIALRKQISASTQLGDLIKEVAGASTKQSFAAFDETLAAFKEIEENLLKEREQAAQQTASWMQSMLVAGMGIVILASLVISYLLARAIARPLTEAVNVAEGICAGDLSRTLEAGGHDEVGRLTQAFNQMVGYLRDQTSKTSDVIGVLAASVAEISATVSELAATASKTSTAVAETTTTVEQVKQAAKISSEKAKRVAEAAQQSVQITETGKRATEDTLVRMNLIKDQMESIGETVVRLSDHSQAIEDIISTVQDLADQSNLLAVNASIEAARAGDQGKGFAVVAQEIKTLADQSKNATEQVRSILQDTRKWVSAVVMATEQGGKAVDAGVTQSASAGDAILSLSNNVAASFQAASLIQSHTEQQFLGVEQVSMAMLSIEQAMKENVSSTSQLELAARRIEQLGVDLKEVVARFRL
jgi:methyl-accepting chemotaxis protein